MTNRTATFSIHWEYPKSTRCIVNLMLLLMGQAYCMLISYRQVKLRTVWCPIKLSATTLKASWTTTIIKMCLTSPQLYWTHSAPILTVSTKASLRTRNAVLREARHLNIPSNRSYPRSIHHLPNSRTRSLTHRHEGRKQTRKSMKMLIQANVPCLDLLDF